MDDVKGVLIWSSEKETQSSTSAGGFYLIAKKFLNSYSNNATVYGCAFVNSKTVKHIRISRIGDLKMLQGSKYVQSDISECFTMIKEDLCSGKKVLFSGTSCQVAAIGNYPFKNKDNLFLIDVICHGVPSPKFWSSYVTYLESKYGGEISNITFRNKTTCNRLGYILKFTCNGKKHTFYQNTDFYYKAFIEGNSLRPSCFCCPFVKDYKTSDLSLGDSNNKEFHPAEAISLVIERTKKGHELLESIKNTCDIKDAQIKEEAQTNKKLVQAASRPKDRDYFYEHLSTCSMECKVGFVTILKQQISNIIPTRIKDYIRRGK